jgi:membrane-associated protease RseP (regulator of RpoE activity)
MSSSTSPPRYWLHGALFIATCATTTLAGGPVFAATLMSILVTHEMGHYLTARHHKIDVSLPYFIPVPFAIGTMGAVIRMRAPIERRNALVDVGASGPLAGLAVAIPLLIIGIARSELVPAGAAGGFIEGNSLLYILLKLIIKGRYLPGGGVDVQLNAMALAAWVGLLVTFINLIPVGQLDGGHVAVALFQHDDRFTGWLHIGLALVGGVVLAVLALEARTAGLAPYPALAYAAKGALPWLVWTVLLLVMRKLAGGEYHPPVGSEPLTPLRRAICWVTLLFFILLFTPVPMREALP